LTQKQLPWDHEQEVRVFTSRQYVPVKLKELVFGCRTSREDEELLRALVLKWHPRIRVTRVDEAALDKPEALATV
jgi:hypothetical protein